MDVVIPSAARGCWRPPGSRWRRISRRHHDPFAALGRAFPPNHLHQSWLDYLYWDTELEEG